MEQAIILKQTKEVYFNKTDKKCGSKSTIA